MDGLESAFKDLEKYSDWTATHCLRVADYTRSICRYLYGVDEERYVLDAKYHDIGKLRVPGELVNNDGRLTSQERARMRKHVAKGGDLVSPYMNNENVSSHHENYDGTGYFSVKGDRIPEGGRIIAVADSFDALVSTRPYKEGIEVDEAIGIIKSEKGKKFDPLVVNALLKYLSQDYVVSLNEPEVRKVA